MDAAEIRTAGDRQGAPLAAALGALSARALWALAVLLLALAAALPMRRWFGLLALDTAGALAAACAKVGMGLSALFTVWCDPLGRAAAPIPVVGGGEYEWVTVAAARTARARRAIAWFLRWHDAPAGPDWRAGMRWLGFDGIPTPFVLGLWAGGACVARLTVECLTLGGPGARGDCRLCLDRGGATCTVAGSVPIDGYTVRGLLGFVGAGGARAGSGRKPRTETPSAGPRPVGRPPSPR
jgi:hypothetical protein